MGGSAPEPGDYRGAAEETAKGNLENLNAQTIANRPNQNTPWGKSEWTKAADGSWTQDITLAGDQQKALDDQMAIQGGRSSAAQGMLGQVQQDTARGLDWGALPEAGGAIRGAQGMQGSLDYSGLSQTPTAGQGIQRGVAGAGDSARNAAEDAIYSRAMSRLTPLQDRQQRQMESKLRNQGLNPGDAAYNEQAAMLGQTQNDAQSSAMWDAITRGGQEQQNQFGMNLQAGQFGNLAQNQDFSQGMAARQQGVGETNQQGQFLNQALMQGQQMDQNQAAWQNQMRSQGINEQQLARNFSLNQLNALLGGQQVQNPQFGGFSQAGVTKGADYSGALGAQDAANTAKWSADQQAMQGWLSGAAGLAGGAMSFMSDERLKTDVTRLKSHVFPGIPLAIYRWKDSGVLELGVIAQDVEKVLPEAVITDPDSGFKRVRYGYIGPDFYPRAI